MDIQFVLTEEAPTYELTIPAEQFSMGDGCLVIVSGIADAIEADAEAEPPVAAVAANTFNVEYLMPAGIDAATGDALAAAWVDSGVAFTADGPKSMPLLGMGKLRLVLSGERDMRVRVCAW